MAALQLGHADDAILRSVNRLNYMTAAQVGRLLYPSACDENRYVQRRLRRLAEADYLLRLRELPTPRIGSAPHVFTLADQGRRYLSSRGVVLTSPYYRPSEERQKAVDNPFMEHTLAAVDVLVAAEMLCRDYVVSMPSLLTERQLKRMNIRVQPAGQPSPRLTAVIPDGWFVLTVGNHDPVCIALELDRGTEGQQHWRRKIAALVAWAEGPYREAFQADNLTVAVVVPTRARLVQLIEWTGDELEAIGKTELADIFLFTEASPTATEPFDLFFSPLWHTAPTAGQLVSMLDAPPSVDSDHASRLVAPPSRPTDDKPTVSTQWGEVEREIELVEEELDEVEEEIRLEVETKVDIEDDDFPWTLSEGEEGRY
ncbi:replication-relaxation family protein [Streptomyces sp. NPDC093514]|uniref:replication-relaxation family protein n=1 Tax=Streptomyces sp. NPDC093514 TaxID=3366039 RepID=UPI0038193C83